LTAVPLPPRRAAWLFVVIEIAELLPGAVLHDTGCADVLD